MESILYFSTNLGLSSTSTLSTLKLLLELDISSNIGPNFKHGPHHLAQKSTNITLLVSLISF
ncbi:hypothetical protein D3C73_1485320 [compost metagenome]